MTSVLILTAIALLELVLLVASHEYVREARQQSKWFAGVVKERNAARLDVWRLELENTALQRTVQQYLDASDELDALLDRSKP